MAVVLKPIRDFLAEKQRLDRVPEEMFPLAERPLPWTGYLAFNEKEQLIGMCGFKDVPDADHRVEIAYYTLPEFEANGYATAMARSLLEMAQEHPAASEVIAHPEGRERLGT
ncbi:MAG: GNAT family N-acetyltransferase, partial [Verrucomicrobiae bacterium]|nr:GNAT family N-acetyltransferase [Verrucomicrobiae bacterium]